MTWRAFATAKIVRISRISAKLGYWGFGGGACRITTDRADLLILQISFSFQETV